MQNIKHACAHVAQGASSAWQGVKSATEVVVDGALYAYRGAGPAAYQGATFAAEAVGARALCAYRGVSSAAEAVKGGATSVITWSKQNPCKCAVLGGLILATSLVAIHVFYPAAFPAATEKLVSVASHIADWASNTAFPCIQNVWRATIVPTVSSKWTALCEALYTNGAVTQLGKGLIGGTAALLAGTVIYVVYRFFDKIKKERDQAIWLRNATITALRQAKQENDRVTSQRDIYIRQNREANGQKDEAVKQRDAANKELDAVKKELARIDYNLGHTVVQVANANEARAEAQRQLAEAQRQLAEANETSAEVQRQLVEAREVRDAALRGNEVAIGMAKGEYLAIIAERDATRGALDVAREEGNVLRRERDAARKELDAVAEELEVAREKRDAAVGELDVARRECDAANNARLQAQRQLSRTRKEHDKAIRDRDAAVRQYETVIAEHDRDREHIDIYS